MAIGIRKQKTIHSKTNSECENEIIQFQSKINRDEK